MVTYKQPEHHPSIAEALLAAEKVTDVEIVTVIAPASDPYQSYVLLYGLVLGSLLACAVWFAHLLLAFPALLAVQFGAIALVVQVPLLRALCFRFIPQAILRHRAAHRAYEEYIKASRMLPSVPVLLIYISLAEHYAHIIPSRRVREHTADAVWDEVIAQFTSNMKREGVDVAVIRAIQTSAEKLAARFPARES